jgi:hypothetical protein
MLLLSLIAKIKQAVSRVSDFIGFVALHEENRNRLLYGQYLDILLAHARLSAYMIGIILPAGFKAFLWVMRVFKPRHLLHGHIHLHDLAKVQKSAY